MNTTVNYGGLSVADMAKLGWSAGMAYADSKKIVIFIAPNDAEEGRTLGRGEFPAIDAYALGGKLREQQPDQKRMVRLHLVPSSQRNGVVLRNPVRYRREAGTKVRFV